MIEGPVSSIDRSIAIFDGIDGDAIHHAQPTIGLDGNINVSAEPTSGDNLTNKTYVDNKIGGFYTGISDGNIITSTTAELSILPLTGIGSLTVPANLFKPGQTYHCVLGGNFSSNNSNTITIRFKSNAVTLTSFTHLMTGTTNEYFEIGIDWVIREVGGAGVADIIANCAFTYSDSGPGQFRGDRIISQNNTTFDTTISNTLEITAQFSTTSSGNSIQTRLMFLKKLTDF